MRLISLDTTASIADTSASGIQVTSDAAASEFAHVEIRAGCVATQYNPQHKLCVALVAVSAYPWSTPPAAR